MYTIHFDMTVEKDVIVGLRKIYREPSTTCTDDEQMSILPIYR